MLRAARHFEASSLCRDTRSAIEAIEALGAKVEILDDNTLIIDGGLCPATNNLYVGESGLAARLFTPIAALCDTPITIDGEGTLLHRPMAMMIEPLKALGVNVRDGGGRLPIEVCGPMNGGEVAVDGSVSSQFITGLLIALPLATNDTTINVHEAVSTPYIDMTLKTLERFGINVMYNEGDYTQFYIEGGQEYQAIDYTIESDWSAAAPSWLRRPSLARSSYVTYLPYRVRRTRLYVVPWSVPAPR